MPRSSIVLLVLLALAGCGHAAPARHAAKRPRSAAQPGRVPERCTDTWAGPRHGGDWGDARNWSADREPGPADQACLDRGTNVVVAGGEHTTGSLIAGGTVTLDGGRLRVIDPSWRVEIGGLYLSRGGTLVAAGPVEITQRLAGTRGDIDFHHGLFIGPATVVHGTATVTPYPPGGHGGSRQPSKTACGPHSPPALQACAGDDTPLSRGARAAWRRFIRLIGATVAGGANGAIAGADARLLLAPRACVRRDEPVPRSQLDRYRECDTTIRLAAAMARQATLSDRVDDLVVVGDRAYGSVDRLGNIRLQHDRGRWRIIHLFPSSR